jgi:hypothetical protein
MATLQRRKGRRARRRSLGNSPSQAPLPARPDSPAPAPGRPALGAAPHARREVRRRRAAEPRVCGRHGGEVRRREERRGGGDASEGAGGVGEGRARAWMGREAGAEGADDGVRAAIRRLHLSVAGGYSEQRMCIDASHPR